jgi:ABC-type glycerol-3-phosphate transport system permease component
MPSLYVCGYDLTRDLLAAAAVAFIAILIGLALSFLERRIRSRDPRFWMMLFGVFLPVISGMLVWYGLVGGIGPVGTVLGSVASDCPITPDWNMLYSLSLLASPLAISLSYWLFRIFVRR